MYDSEIKYIFNFLKNHMNKGDEYIIETKNIFRTCGSCKREFVMLEDYLRTQGKQEFQIPVKRPFWVFSEKDGFQQFFFIYLDENSENPSVWFTTYGDEEDGPNVIIKLSDTFSQFIDELIDRSILFAQRGY